MSIVKGVRIAVESDPVVRPSRYTAGRGKRIAAKEQASKATKEQILKDAKDQASKVPVNIYLNRLI